MSNKIVVASLSLWLAFSPLGLLSQNAPNDINYNFLALDKNQIENGTAALDNFFAKLYDISETKKGQAVILHIGDSHVEAEHFPAAVRAGLQHVFGDAGHGLIKPKFPKRFAYKKRVWYVATSLEKPQAVNFLDFKVGLKEDDPAQGFNRLVFFHEKGAQYLDFQIFDMELHLLATVRASLATRSPDITMVNLPGTYREVRLRTVKSKKSQKYAQIYGISLENSASGVLYHSYGIVGGSTESYIRSPYFQKQLETLQPDLVIISLGTNDASGVKLNEDVFAANLSALLSEIQAVCPQSAVILTTAAESYRRPTRRGKQIVNPNIPAIQNSILQLGQKMHFSIWDFFSIMGGLGSMKLWQRNALASYDLIHFTKEGYQLQGKLLCEALLNGFRTYAKTRTS